jgi:D-alanine-D-alanine ligase
MKVAVLFGGTSSERDVSIASGSQVMRALHQAGHEILAIDTAKGLLSAGEQQRLLEAGVAPEPPAQQTLALLHSNTAALAQSSDFQKVDVVFLALHGGSGEDGTLQGFFELLGLPHTGSGVRGSANAMDKDTAKRLCLAAGIPTADWLMTPIEPATVEARLGYPLVVKPNKEGSTIGLTVVKKSADLAAALALAGRYDDEVMLEKFVPGRELTVGILGDRALAVGEIIPKRSEIFDYESKYQPGGAEEIFPADLSLEQTTRIQDLGLRTHRALKLEDYSRVDFRLDPNGDLWVLEANTLPGMTATSLLPQSAAAVGISFPELCHRICQLAIERQQHVRQRR